MSDSIDGFAAWHQTKGFDEFHYEGAVVFADLSEEAGGVIDIVKDLNDLDGTTPENGWKAVKVKITRITE